MLPDFEMLCYHFPQKEDITIIPIADVHFGAKECKEKEFIAFVDTIAKRPNTFWIGGGDFLNNGTRSSVSNIFEETRRPSVAKRELAQILEPIADKCLAMVGGNHERRSGKDADDQPLYDVCVKLNIEDRYRENVAFVKIQFGEKERANGTRTSGEDRPCYVLTVTHGNGGGIYTSGAVLKGERYGYALEGSDVLIVGHTHKPFTTHHGKIFIDPRNNKVSVKPFKVVSCTSWMEYGGYAAQKMLLPTAHCLHTVSLCGGHKEIVVTM